MYYVFYQMLTGMTMTIKLINSLSACVYTFQKVKEQLKEYRENKILHRGPVSFGDDSNGISVTFDPVHVPGWTIDFRDIHCEKV